ncbi:MAG: hypothetical protein NTW16_01940 [Bacteroidetes bacterium]|nr:hypothetical protein [Bacteroidota bacterium]
MIDVYYPYFEAESTWQELRYSLRSIEKHFKFDFRVVILGDLPAWINPASILYIPHDRVEGIQENTLYDAITKQLLFNAHPDTSLHFVRMYDDIYILRDVDLITVGQFKAMYPFREVPERTGTWWSQLYHTLDVLIAKGYQGWNTETHLPELFNKEKMQWIITTYSALEKRLLTSSLYFNTFFPGAQPQLFSKEFAIQFYDNADGPFYDSSEGDLNKKCKGKTYLNHNNAGLTDNLKNFLKTTFPHKSRFEL